jgi:hypothetical protein
MVCFRSRTLPRQAVNLDITVTAVIIVVLYGRFRMAGHYQLAIFDLIGPCLQGGCAELGPLTMVIVARIG